MPVGVLALQSEAGTKLLSVLASRQASMTTSPGEDGTSWPVALTVAWAVIVTTSPSLAGFSEMVSVTVVRWAFAGAPFVSA
jgi:hypothetical protein